MALVETHKPLLCLTDDFSAAIIACRRLLKHPPIIGDTIYPRPQVSLKDQAKALPACDSSSGSFDRGSDLLVVQHEYADACYLSLLRLRHHVCLVRGLS